MTELRRLESAAASATDDDIVAWYAVADRAVPWLRANFVSSIDGAATHDGLSGGLGTHADARVFGILRRLADVVIVGAGTVRAEGYGGVLLDDEAVDWRIRNGLAPHPVFAIVSGSLDLDPAAGVFADAPVRPIVITTSSAPGDRRDAIADVADVIDCGEASVDTVLMRAALGQRGLTQLHCEGGPHLFGTMIAQGTLDELCLTLSPRLEGGVARRIADGSAATPTAMTLAHVLSADDGTLLLRYTRTR